MSVPQERKPLLPAPMHVDSELAEHARALVSNIQTSDKEDQDLIAAQNKAHKSKHMFPCSFISNVASNCDAIQ